MKRWRARRRGGADLFDDAIEDPASAHELHDSDKVDLVGAVEGAVQLGGGLLPISLYISGEFIYVQLCGSQYSSSTLL